MSIAELPAPRIAHAAPADPPLTIAMASTQRGFRGGEIQVRLLAQGFRRAGHRPVIVARRGGALAQRMAAENFELLTFAGGGRNPLALWSMRRELARLRPDVLYFNDSHALSGLGLISRGLPIAARVAARRVTFPIRTAWTYRGFSDVVLASSGAVGLVCRNGGVAAGQVRVVCDGLPPLPAPTAPRDALRRSLGYGPEDQVLLTVGALTAEKGHAVMLGALALLADQYPRLRWACAGEGPLLAGLTKEATHRGIRERIRFLGQREDVPDLLSAADAFVLPSLYEGLCNAAIEALYARAPLVVSDAGGLKEIAGVDDPEGPVARVAPVGGSMAVAAAIEDVLANPEKNRRLAERGFERVNRLFTAERMVVETLAVFREAIAAKRGKMVSGTKSPIGS